MRIDLNIGKIKNKENYSFFLVLDILLAKAAVDSRVAVVSHI